MNKWRFVEAWNAAAKKDNRPLEPRDYAYASELLMPKVDRFLKMRAVPYTNPPNDRSLRKFFAGKGWEYIVKMVLLTCGIYQKEEIKVNSQPYSDYIPVHGRLDFIVGGLVSEKEALARAEELPDFLKDLAASVIRSFAGIGLKMRVMEVKSVSKYALEYVEKRREPMNTHHAQAHYYQHATGLPASVAYISKDNALMAEYFVNAEKSEPLMREDLEQMTYYFTRGIQPENEPLMGFDYGVAKFTKNLGVEYSPYLSMLYGYQNPDEYRRSVEPMVKRWNNALQRYAQAELGKTTPTGKPIVPTPANKEVRQEIITAGYNFSEILDVKIAAVEAGDEDEEE